MRVAGLTHPGRERSRNEDCYLVRTGTGLTMFAVADGMGGHVAGDVASAAAISVLERYWTDVDQSALPADNCFGGIVQNLFTEANQLIFAEAANDLAKQGMGTTLTMGLLRENCLTIGHVGDSRAYLISDQCIKLLTKDHSLVEQMIQAGRIEPGEAQAHPQRHILTRALGTGAEVEVDLIEHELAEGSALLFCTDGLTSLVREDEILSFLLKQKADPAQTAASLVELANDRGGSDNITVVYATDIGRQGI